MVHSYLVTHAFADTLQVLASAMGRCAPLCGQAAGSMLLPSWPYQLLQMRSWVNCLELASNAALYVQIFVSFVVSSALPNGSAWRVCANKAFILVRT